MICLGDFSWSVLKDKWRSWNDGFRRNDLSRVITVRLHWFGSKLPLYPPPSITCWPTCVSSLPHSPFIHPSTLVTAASWPFMNLLPPHHQHPPPFSHNKNASVVISLHSPFISTLLPLPRTPKPTLYSLLPISLPTPSIPSCFNKACWHHKWVLKSM